MHALCTSWIAALGATLQGVRMVTYPQPRGKTLIVYEGFTPSASCKSQVYDYISKRLPITFSSTAINFDFSIH